MIAPIQLQCTFSYTCIPFNTANPEVEQRVPNTYHSKLVSSGCINMATKVREECRP